MQKLINNPEYCVDDSIRGLIATSPNLRLIQGSRVVVRADVNDVNITSKVAVICGGGSGHEPAFAGYVGKGFLSAGICGDVFTSPNPNQILAALNACRRPAGILVVVFNYTGDRLNFAIAVERFKTQSNACPVRMVTVADDCALTDMKDRSAGRRGLAGGIMVLKIASAAAERGLGLDEIAQMSENVITSLRTIGVSLSSCSLPGRGPLFELPNDEMELGLGVHGEPGVARMKTATAAQVIDRMLKRMTDPGSATSFNLKEGEKIVVLLNNLGGISQIEMNIVAKETLEWLNAQKVNIRRVISGPIMTSLDMRGISISVLKLTDPHWLEFLDAEVECVAWPATHWRQRYSHQFVFAPNLIIPGEKSDINPTEKLGQNMAAVSESTAAHLKAAIEAACSALIKAQKELDDLDGQCGDGDCGATMKRGAEAILKALPSFDYTPPSSLLQGIACTWQQNTGGTSGAIYSLFFMAAANALSKCTDFDAWLNALIVGTEAVMKYGGAKPGDRTLVDPLHAAAEFVKEKHKTGQQPDKKWISDFQEVIKKSVESTASMQAKAGRASYVASAHLRSPDPGAMAFHYWISAAISTFGQYQL